MGLFKDAKRAAQSAGSFGAGAVPGGLPEGMSMPDPSAMSMPDPAHVAMVNKIGQSGVEAPAEIKAIRATGSPDISGATPHEFDVTVTPAGGQPYDTTIRQSMLEMQMNGLTEGKAVTVKYDPDNPSAALLHSW